MTETPRGQGRRPPGGRRRPGSRPRFDDLEDEEPLEEAGEYAEDEEPEEARPARRPGRPRPRAGGGRAPAAPKRRSSWGLFGSKKPPRGRRTRRDEGFDWGAAEDEEAEYGDGGYDERDDARYDEPRARRRHAAPREKRPERLTLMQLCTPVFGYAAVLPRDMGGVQPGYDQFRQEVLNALQKIESDAPSHGIDRDDAAKAVYALSLFMDEQVGESEWTGKISWMNEPLSIVKLQDPEGGIRFFDMLESFSERQKPVKEIFLVCLALGFRGKYAELDVTQQSARIAEVRQKVLRSIHPAPLESRRLLFPEAYTEAYPLEEDAPPPPRWWVAASLGTVAACLLIYILLFWAAGRAPAEAETTLGPIATQGAAR